MDAQDAGAKVSRRRNSVQERRTDRDRWEDPASYEAFWSRRAKIAATLARKGERVCDIGCGAHQTLHMLLPPETEYFPADLKSWTPNVLACDLNAGDLPSAYLRHCHVAYLLGVIEYIYDLPKLFAMLAQEIEYIVVSYNCTDFAEVDRAGFGWANALTSADLEKLLTHAGFNVAQTRRVEPMEILIRAHSRHYGWWRRVRRQLSARISAP